MAEAMLGVNIDVIVGHLKIMFPQYDINILTNIAQARTLGLEEVDMDIVMSNCIDDLSGMDPGVPDYNNGDIHILESTTELPRSCANQGTGPLRVVDLTESPDMFGPPSRKRRRESQKTILSPVTYQDSFTIESDESSTDLPDLDFADGRSSFASGGDAGTRDTATLDSLDDADSRSGRASSSGTRDTATPDSLADADSRSSTRDTATPDSLADIDPDIQDDEGDLPDIVAAAITNVFGADRPATAMPPAVLPNRVVATATAVPAGPRAVTATVSATIGGHGVITATATAAGRGVTVTATASGPMVVTPMETIPSAAPPPRLVAAPATATKAGPLVVTPIATAAPVAAPRLVTATATQAGQIVVNPIAAAAPHVPREMIPEVPAPQAVVDQIPLPLLLPLHDPFPELLAVPAVPEPPRAPTPVPEPPPREPTPEEVFEEKVDNVLKLFPLADPEFLRTTMRTFLANEVEFMVNHLLENDSYPRLQKKKVVTPVAIQKINYFDVTRIRSVTHSPLYKEQCHQMLQADFKKVSVRDLRKLQQSLNYNYALIYKVLVSAKIPTGPATTTVGANSSTEAAGSSPMQFTVNVMTAENETYPYVCRRLKCGRNNHHVSRPYCDELEAELDFVQKEMREEIENKDRLMAELVNENEYEETGQLIECGCCYGEIPFEQMVQCYEGHLFCRDCLTNYAKEAVYGQGKAELTCMSDGCPSSFPKDQLERALPTAMIEKYEERLKDEALNLAGIEDLVRCPACDYAACLPPEDKVFTCQNPSCLKETCRHCKEDWAEHFGIPCSELEKKDETKMRLAYEEKMTQAMMRSCHRCKASFTKTEGCNRMTCRCKATMCYICRKPEISYEHFCRHARDPGKACTSCKQCSLWSDPKEDDERAVQEVKKAAMEERKAKGYDEDKEIGAPDEPKKSPPKKVRPPAPPQRPPPQRPAQAPHFPANLPPHLVQQQHPAQQPHRDNHQHRARHRNHDRDFDRRRFLLQMERQHQDHHYQHVQQLFEGQQRPPLGMPPPAHNNQFVHYAQPPVAAAVNYAGNQPPMPNQQLQGGAPWNNERW